MNTVVCLSGCSGSGKSTYARKLTEGAGGHNAAIHSADYFFEGDGGYKFDAKRLGEAHAKCFRAFLDDLQSGRCLLVIDNTNTSPMEIAPYALAARAYGWDFEIITVQCDPAVAAARNKHGVPEKKVREQADRIAKRQLPGYWRASIVKSDEVSK